MAKVLNLFIAFYSSGKKTAALQLVLFTGYLKHFNALFHKTKTPSLTIILLSRA